MKIYLASDHGGYALKEEVKKYLQEKNYNVEDLGNKTLDPGDDYPDFVIPLAEKVAKETESYGFIFGRSGNGELVAANKIKGIRAVMGCSVKMAQVAREHNDANVLSMGADYVSRDDAAQIVEAFLTTTFLKEERHVRRLEKISNYEDSKS